MKVKLRDLKIKEVSPIPKEKKLKKKRKICDVSGAELDFPKKKKKNKKP